MRLVFICHCCCCLLFLVDFGFVLFHFVLFRHVVCIFISHCCLTFVAIHLTYNLHTEIKNDNNNKPNDGEREREREGGRKNKVKLIDTPAKYDRSTHTHTERARKCQPLLSGFFEVCKVSIEMSKHTTRCVIYYVFCDCCAALGRFEEFYEGNNAVSEN